MSSTQEPHLHLRWGISCFSTLSDTQSCSPTNKKSWCRNSIRLFERPSSSVQPRLREN